MTASILKSSGKTILALCLLAASSGLQAAGGGNVSYPSTTMPGYETDNSNGLPSINAFPATQAGYDRQQQPQTPQTGRGNSPYPQRIPLNLDDNGYELNPLDGKPKLPPFTDYVQKATEKTLPIFGSKLFRNPYNNFESADGVQVNPDYVIGSGDQLQVKGWGMVDIDLALTVDRNGSIYLPRVGSIAVAGVRYRDLQGLLKKSVSRVFNNFDLSVSLAQSRSVQVYVVGHARQPGSYTLNAMSTLLNALLKAGGPDDSGSLRRVALMRDGKEVAKVDLYAILVDGDKSEDQTLRDGDVIQIPAAGPRVALLGDVKTPAIYEFRDGENVRNLLHWAGGLESAAEGKELWIEKSVNNRFANVGRLQGDYQTLSSLALTAGDIFRLHVPGAQPVSVQKNDEFVSVGGEVEHTGTFQIRKGETLRQLIMRLGGVNDDGYVFATQLKRESIRQMQQQKLDEVSGRFEKELEQNAAGRLSRLTDKDAIASVTAEVERQRQIAAKMRTVKAEGRVVLELQDANAQVKDLPDLELQDGDQVEIPRRPGTVNVLGAVYQSNAFIYRPQRSVSDYLALAGGVVDSGDKSSIYVLRADGTVASSNNGNWFSGVGGKRINPGDTIVVPEELNAGSWTQALKEWTSILYQFGLGAAGLKVLK
ncbi:SLBB domain-containing protein [Chromobacterium sphagni]|uniref:Sugar ABC transporter substrate-binding protein n=1 Tax=Chromobacterium sphagni TaxID=1903179 RepID=A0A1S1WZA5_9NEIS|nr:SLBB domain-containing protein [Chromobacterium sphagni]OHX12633.1 sugar ABC transporter substrate-binding protein [Chromobacterium sphagni]OHX21282.1 sugar ABC transporter substrate-binding protein [Chromobacterium sphagni]